MSDKTKIEWTDATWNPVTGCTRVSPGCTNCYIDWAPPFRINDRHFRDAMGERSHAIGSTTGVLLHPDRLDQPMRWKRPRRIFVNSLSDLFHDSVPDEYIAKVFAAMAVAPQHTFQLLTKRHARMRSLLSSTSFPELVTVWAWRLFPGRAIYDAREVISLPLPNVWLGVTVEDQERADLRIPALLETPAAVRWLSCEPLLGPITLTRLHARCETHDFEGGFCTGGCPDVYTVDWIVVGGESGPGARPMHPGWARGLRDQSTDLGIPFLFKQWGEWTSFYSVLDLMSRRTHIWEDGRGPNGADTRVCRIGKRYSGRDLDGRTWDEYPQVGVA